MRPRREPARPNACMGVKTPKMAMAAMLRGIGLVRIAAACPHRRLGLPERSSHQVGCARLAEPAPKSRRFELFGDWGLCLLWRRLPPGGARQARPTKPQLQRSATTAGVYTLPRGDGNKRG